MDRIYDLAQPFVWNAGRAFAVALAFLALHAAAVRMTRHRRGPGKPLLVVAAAWAVFGALEAWATHQRADIRVDLLVTWPVLWLVTLAGIGLWIRRSVRPSR